MMVNMDNREKKTCTFTINNHLIGKLCQLSSQSYHISLLWLWLQQILPRGGEEEEDEDEGERRQKEGNGLQPTQVKADGRIGESEGMEGRESGNKTTFAEIFWKEKFRYFQTHKREIFTYILNIHIYKILKKLTDFNWLNSSS